MSRIGQAIFAGLTEVDGDTGAIIPDLAVALPTVANGGVTVGPDGTTRVTFRIRQEAVWENGTPVTGDDVAFTYQAIMDAGSLSLDRTPYEAITAVAAEGKSVTLTFAAPTLAFETMFPVVLPRHQVEGTDLVTDWNDRPWLSAGPFRLESWVRNDLRYFVIGDAAREDIQTLSNLLKSTQ